MKMKKNIITITGDLASGKSTVTKILADELNYSIYKNGEYFRKLAIENGMSVTEFNEYVKKHPEIDKQIELSATLYAEQNDNLIIDARLGWYSVPDSFKVYLKVELDVAAERAFNDQERKETENFTTIEEYKKDLVKRYSLENDRYYHVYGVIRTDESNYDLIIDTTNRTPEDVAQEIKDNYFKWLNT